MGCSIGTQSVDGKQQVVNINHSNTAGGTHYQAGNVQGKETAGNSLDHTYKKMKDIVPYEEKWKKLLELIGPDITDDIPDVHEADAEFVTDYSSRTAHGLKGVYTGWMKKKMMHGRGTFLLTRFGGRERYDGMWINGSFNGKGRYMWGAGAGATQGIWQNGNATEGMMSYKSNGEVSKFTNPDDWIEQAPIFKRP